ncbi:MAG: hypothetical protein RJB13_633, partial [Pseudomonadota bacterium]
MKSINKKKIHVSKATKSEKLLARLLLPFLLFVVFLMEISLGSRSHSETKGFFEKARSTATEKIRGWEKPAAEGTWRSKTDGRSNAGFHFNWPKSAEPPEFDSLPNSEDRADKLKKAIILGKSKIRVEFDTSDDKLNWLEEPLNSAGEVLLRKKVIMMLPGDRLKLKNFQQTSIPKVWSIRVRAVAVTQDRLDAPLPVRVGFLAETSFRSEIDPLGQHFDIIIPPPAEIQRNKPNDFVIEWPATNSGILVIDGIKPIESNSAVGKKNHKNLIVHIDNLGTQIAALKKTIKTIKGLSSERQGTILIRNAIPSTTDTGISKEALLVNRNPIELGATISNPNLKELITRDYFLVKRAIQQGGSARKIVLNSGLTCESNCTDANISLNSQSAFTSTLTISRIEEFESTKRFIRNDEFITDPGLLYVEINNPSDTLRLNSETKINSQSSSITWLFSGLLRPFGYTNSKLQFEEKLAQLDNWLAKLMESFLVTSHSANIAVILHDNSQALSLGKNQMRRSVTRGEILLHLNELSDSRNQREDVLTFDEPVSSLSVMRMFSKRAFSSQLISAVEEFIPELKGDAVAVNQLQRTQLITITPSGWLIDPIENGDSKIRNYMAIASPEKIHEIQEVSNRMRQRSRLISINFAFPGSNQ